MWNYQVKYGKYKIFILVASQISLQDMDSLVLIWQNYKVVEIRRWSLTKGGRVGNYTYDFNGDVLLLQLEWGNTLNPDVLS